MRRIVKREQGSNSHSSSRSRIEGNNEAGTSSSNEQQQSVAERRVLRSQYFAVKKLINDEREDLTNVDSDKFNSIINEVESLHHFVQKPREQVADAEALLDITTTLVTSVKAQNVDGLTPSDFVTFLLRDFGRQNRASCSTEDCRSSIVWKDIGFAVSHVIRRAPVCQTMLGPMNIEIKQRKAVVLRKHAIPTEVSHPEEFDDTSPEGRTDTDNNMSTMFSIMKNNRGVRLENLVLNRNSFAQTVENLFTLSFLVKDGRAEITVNETGCHLVSPRNAPAAHALLSRDVSYSHFVFRLDFKDWKMMLGSIEAGEELMPHRNPVNVLSTSEPVFVSGESQETPPTTPIRKLSRNRGLVLQEQAVVEDSPESSDSAAAKAATIRKRKRKNKWF